MSKSGMTHFTGETLTEKKARLNEERHQRREQYRDAVDGVLAATPELLEVCRLLAAQGAVIATTGLGDRLRAAIVNTHVAIVRVDKIKAIA